MINQVQRQRRPRRRSSSSLSLRQSTPSLQPIPEGDDDQNVLLCSPTSVRTNFLPPRHSHPHKAASLVDTPELVNQERELRGLRQFHSSHWLDQLAAKQAAAMARTGSVFHSVRTIDELMLLLSSAEVAENIQRGDTVEGMHRETMNHTNAINRSNLLSTFFTEFGYGVARGSDGKLYSCQLFRN